MSAAWAVLYVVLGLISGIVFSWPWTFLPRIRKSLELSPFTFVSQNYVSPQAHGAEPGF